jgi:hypothetical protein
MPMQSRCFVRGGDVAKSIFLTDEQYKTVTDAALRCGFLVQRGRGSQLALFIVAASKASTKTKVKPPRLKNKV